MITPIHTFIVFIYLYMRPISPTILHIEEFLKVMKDIDDAMRGIAYTLVGVVHYTCILGPRKISGIKTVYVKIAKIKNHLL